MSEQNLTDKIIDRIKQGQLKPRPRWSFVFKNYFLWFLGVLSVILGAISFSLMIYLFASGNALINNNFGASLGEILLVIVPIFWLVFLVAFIILFYLNLKRTKKAYRYSPLLILLIGLISSLALGSTFYLFGLSQKFDNLLGKNINSAIYGRFLNPQIEFWSDPAQGRLSGLVSAVGPENSLFIIDKDSQEWLVIYLPEANRHFFEINPGVALRFFGQQINDNQFQATRIMPLTPGREFFNRNGVHQRLEENINNQEVELRRRRMLDDCWLLNNNPQ